MTDPGQLFNNTSSQAERERELRNEQRVRGHTFQSRAIAEADDIRGRWRETHKASVVGSDSAVHYPMAAPNWSVDPTGVEPPVGYDINEVPVVGEPHEIQASLGDVLEGGPQPVASPGPGQPATTSVDPSRGGAEAPSAALVSPRRREPPANPNPKPRTRKE
jgi:hypothetical protein